MKNYAIKVKNLSKKYNIKNKRNHFEKKTDIGARKFPFLFNRKQPFMALDDISFNLMSGESLGIMGHNGAGKSTLLKVISKVTHPTSGQVELFGRVGALLEVGTGFDPNLSGRENIFLYSSILGFSRLETQKYVDEIIDFSGVEKFIDKPLRTYSSGMYSRLAFSVGVHINSEILLVDEILSVGDAEFQNKSYEKMTQIIRDGRSIIFVSHNISAMNNLCDRGIILDKGKIIVDSPINQAISDYKKIVSFEGNENPKKLNPFRFEFDQSLPVQFLSAAIVDENSSPEHLFSYESEVVIKFNVKIRKRGYSYYIGFTVEDQESNRIMGPTDETEDGTTLLSGLDVGEYWVQAKIPGKIFRPGEYSLTIGIGSPLDGRIVKHQKALHFEIIENNDEKNFKATSVGLVDPDISISFFEK